MIDLRERAQQAVEAYRVWRRRRRLMNAYAKVGKARYGLGPGFTPTLFAYDRLTSEGLATIAETEDGAELVWHWPDEAEEVA